MLTLTFLGILALALTAHFSGEAERIDRGVLARLLASRSALGVVFVITFIVLWYSWGGWKPIPVVHDELAYVLQAQIYARGHWALPSPPLPLFWEQPQVLVEPTLSAKYFPGHPLLLAIGVLLGWAPLMPLVLQSLCAVMVFVLARRLAGGAVAFATWMIWLFTPMVLYFGASYFSEATTTLCWLTGWYALLEWRETRKTRWLLLVALSTGWDAIARPLTGVAYAIPIAVVVLHDVITLRLWRDLVQAFVVGALVVSLIPLWSARTTGDWRTTPLTLYTRTYMPYDTPGFGLDTTSPPHSITADLQMINRAYSSLHIHHFPSELPRILGERMQFLLANVWGSNKGILIVFAVLGLVTLRAASTFALATGAVLLLTYLVFAAPANWSLYYYESVPAYAFLTASGMAWAAAQIGRPRRVALSGATVWRAARWTRAMVASSLLFALPGVVALQATHGRHIRDRRLLDSFADLLSSIHDDRAIVFVRYSETHDPHVSFVRNSAKLHDERVWVVYDRGDRENQRLLASARDRKAYLFDEVHGKTYQYLTEARP